MTLKKALQLTPILFFFATTFFFLILGIQATFLYPDMSLSGSEILKCLLMTFTLSLPTYILVYKENASLLERIIRVILHFITTAVLSATFLIHLGFLVMETAIYAFIVFAVMYAVGYTFMELRDRRLAAKLNEKISALESDDEQDDADA